MSKVIKHSNGLYTDFETNKIEITDISGYEVVEYKNTQLHADYEAIEWCRNRQAEYSKKSATEQIEMMLDGTIDAWYSNIKSMYPKP